ncbi:MAG: DivIVA domain-containing protein [Candidatus Electryonea clarkiae]|nr:DivIVA domain-containing protein [Candidatus Electryonea clarkiae]MDP8289307.1 DivIVA domain-containing protein [Candidatus Electryonea clarkiae]
MNVSPLDIRKQEFNRKARGYDVDEVTSFLEMVADQFEQLLKKATELEKEVELFKGKTSEFQQKESSLHDSVMDAQRLHQQKAEKAQQEAELAVQKAHLEADKIIHQARKKHHRILDEIHRLEGQRQGFLIKMRHILKSQIDLMEIIEQESPADNKAALSKKSNRLRSGNNIKATTSANGEPGSGLQNKGIDNRGDASKKNQPVRPVPQAAKPGNTTKDS